MGEVDQFVDQAVEHCVAAVAGFLGGARGALQKGAQGSHRLPHLWNSTESWKH